MIRKLEDDMILYHGSYCEVKRADIKKCARYKDFGQGFYLTASREQAEKFAGISTKKAIANERAETKQNYSIVSAFKFKYVEDIRVKVYPEADVEWLHCVVGHRKKDSFPGAIDGLKGTDIVGGKIANDDTNAMITAYMAGAYGEMGTRSADDICISLLLPERLQDQFCFRTQRALACITFMGSEKIWL